jgi:NAD(P)-dependent dehydrogenase (short-subunit alcohol dehydrogenase family)
MVFFITGGSRGIGRSIVLGVLAEGHDVAFTYVAQKEAAEEVLALAKVDFPARRCRAYQLDVSDPAAVEHIGEAVLSDFGCVHVVVNNAAINRPELAISLENDDWHRIIEANLSGPFFVSRQFLSTFLAEGFGRFIHISSVSEDGTTGQVAYSASKAGLRGLSGALAKEYGRKGITSNILVLGFFETDMTREQMSQENKTTWMKLCPLGRMGKLSEVSAAVLFLASSGASFINGQSVPLTGGLDWMR